MVQATVVCAICENNEIYPKKEKKAFHNAFHVPKNIFFVLLFFVFVCFFPGKTGIPKKKIKDLKDVFRGCLFSCSNHTDCVCSDVFGAE